jgi:guanylate kinase
MRREGERHGVEYYFVDVDEFERMITAGEFLEYAHVYGDYYGTSLSFVYTALEAGRDVLLDIDVQGALNVKRLSPEAIMVFVMPPSFQVLAERLRSRGLDNAEAIAKRLSVAVDEIKYFLNYDYVIINRDLEESARELETIVLAARCRVRNRRKQAEKIAETFES